MIRKVRNLPVQGLGGGWVEDPLEPEERPHEAPVGFVETLPVDPEGPSRKPRRTRKFASDRVKIGWGSERVNRRSR